MRKLVVILFLSIPCLVLGQEIDSTKMVLTPDSVFIINTTNDIYALGDTLPTAMYGTTDLWRPNANRAVWLGALVPGLGQIYNRSYWKLPIVYGGFMGCIYALVWNNSMYTDYKQAYRDILTDVELSTDPERSYNAILPKGYTIASMGGRASYTNTLNSKQNLYRRYRDFSILAAVAVYALSLIDAYVDAQLFDFDVSPDLSLNVGPQIYNDLQNRRSAEIKLALTIK